MTMALFKLGRVDEALVSYSLLEDLLGDPRSWKYVVDEPADGAPMSAGSLNLECIWSYF